MPRALLASSRFRRLPWLLLAAACAAPTPLSSPAPTAALAPQPPQESHTLGISAPRGAWAQTPAAISQRLPSTAAGSVELRGETVALGFRLSGARPVPASSAEDAVRYAGALGEGTELTLRPRPDGVEDLVRFERAPDREQVDYLLDLRRVAGLRKIGAVLEFLDEAGAPRLRMEAPYMKGADGAVAWAEVEVGCAHDEDPRGPWGRAVMRAGAEECRVSVRWGGQGVRYPAVLDPVWTTTGSMAKDRGYAGFGLLDSGRFLVAGGRSCLGGSCTSLASSEIYDPATGTWAQGSLLNKVHDAGASAGIPGVGVMVLGNDSKTDTVARTAELYREDTASWEALPLMFEGRQESMALLTADKKRVIVVGGLSPAGNFPLASIEIFDVASKSWSGGGFLNKARYLGSVTELPDGKILVAGGSSCGSCGPIADAELYDPVTQTSAVLPDLLQAHFGQATGLLQVQGKTKVLIAGGGAPECELFDIETKTWAYTGSMNNSLVYMASTTLSDGSFLVAGGALIPSFEGNFLAERFDPVSLTWKPAGLAASAHTIPAFTQLAGGKFLVAGGAKNNFLTGTETGAAVDVFEAQAQAQPCQGSGECASNFCADGVCCESACEGLCQACTAAKKGEGLDGACGPVADATDPDDECAAQDKSTCGTSGSCDGLGACARYPANTPCGSAICNNSVASGLLCTGDGKCQQDVKPCGLFLCKDPTACATSCTDDDQCAASAHCDGKVCAADRPQGQACARSAECQSGFCVDGVCCDTSCEGTCQACAAALKEGGADGLCGPALVATDPHDDCADEPLLGCDRNGLCDGKGSCALYAAGVACQPATCVSDAQGGFRLGEFVCDGSGTCQASEGASCGAFGCEQGVCKTSCAGDDDCAEEAYCGGGLCVARKPLGGGCQEARECLGGLCVDGVCCSSPCEGPCEACNKEGALGLCVPVSGAPVPGHPACPAAPLASPCEQRTCDGTVREVCAAFVGPETSCRAPSCAEGVAVLAAACDGKGGCPEQETARCEPFVCSGTSCGVACTSDADCERRFQCDIAQGDCIPRTVAVCDGESTLINPDGTTTDCAPYGCEGSSCKTRCASVQDCVLPNVCDDATRACIPAPPNAIDDAGCHAAPTPRGAGGALPGLLGLLLVLARRRGAPHRG